jgi:DNA-binding NarL/FixJ family response regulator
LTTAISTTQPTSASCQKFERTAATRILIADQNGIVRYGLSTLLKQQFHCEIDEAANTAELREALPRETWGLVVLDPTLPGPSWIEVLTSAVETMPRIPFLIFANHPDARAARRALRIGAMGYISKRVSVPELGLAVRSLLSRNRYVSSEVLGTTTLALPGDQPVQELLSRRELHVMLALTSGKSVSQISAELCISVKSVSTYRARLLTKLRVENNMDLMRYAIQHSLV